MWEAIAFPVNPWKVSRQESVPPARLRTSVALKVPPALARTPAGFGTSCAALSRAMKPVLAALSAPCPATPRPVQTPAARSAGSTAALTISRCFPTLQMITRGARAADSYRTTKDVVRMRVFGRIGPTFSMFRVSW